MHVLISNDDGIGAAGIKTLADAFIRDGHRVSIAAPDRQRSAASQSITFYDLLTARRTPWPGAEAWAVSGTPADCVKLALMRFVRDVDVVVSGINAGFNIGTDVHYSGTVAAAKEGAFAGVPAIAVSVSSKRPDLYETAADYALKAAKALAAKPIPPLSVLNINIPDVPADGILGERAARLARLRYDEYYLEQENSRVGKYYWLLGELAKEQEEGDTDCALLRAGYVTYTVLGYDWTLRGEAERFLQDKGVYTCKNDANLIK